MSSKFQPFSLGVERFDCRGRVGDGKMAEDERKTVTESGHLLSSESQRTVNNMKFRDCSDLMCVSNFAITSRFGYIEFVDFMESC